MMLFSTMNLSPSESLAGVLGRIRQLEGRLLRSVTRPSPSGSLRFSMRSSGTSGGSSDSAGTGSLPPSWFRVLGLRVICRIYTLNPGKKYTGSVLL